MPMGGYGMNAEIADAANLSWLIAATVNGWAPPSILDAYEAERQPVTDQLSRFTMDSATRILQQRCEIPSEIEWPGPIGDAIPAQVGKEAYEIDLGGAFKSALPRSAGLAFAVRSIRGMIGRTSRTLSPGGRRDTVSAKGTVCSIRKSYCWRYLKRIFNCAKSKDA